MIEKTKRKIFERKHEINGKLVDVKKWREEEKSKEKLNQYSDICKLRSKIKLLGLTKNKSMDFFQTEKIEHSIYSNYFYNFISPPDSLYSKYSYYSNTFTFAKNSQDSNYLKSKDSNLY